jgi:hypothetical protein
MAYTTGNTGGGYVRGFVQRIFHGGFGFHDQRTVGNAEELDMEWCLADHWE